MNTLRPYPETLAKVITDLKRVKNPPKEVNDNLRLVILRPGMSLNDFFHEVVNNFFAQSVKP